MPPDPLAAALQAADALFPAIVERLAALVAIPSCSFPGFDPAQVERSATATAAWLREVGFPTVEIRRLDGVHPYVLASDRRAGPAAPTVLLYAHHDVQPPLRLEAWRTPPFTATRQGDRLYGRGAADDKGGIAVHAAAMAAWTQACGRPPVNVLAVIEGEEEIGSHHLPAFVDRFRAELACDCLVIADLQNVDTGVPSLTTSLRGLVVLELEVQALQAPVHSGMWGGAVTDPTLVLARLVSGLTDADGRLAVAEAWRRVRPLTPAEAASFARIPYDPALIARQGGMLHPTLPADPVAFYRRLWREPAVSVNLFTAGAPGQTGNVVMDRASARVGIRIVPDMDARETAAAVERHLRAALPPGAALTVRPVSLGEPWGTPTDHPLFALAHQALAIGYGRPALEMGCGASIPFVGACTERLGGIPALLIGVEDPACAAHSENESVSLPDLQAAIRSEVALLHLLATAAPAALRPGRA